MTHRFGCNTLYPGGRLPALEETFDLPALRQALLTIRDAGFDGCEFSHYQHLIAPEQERLREMCSCMGLQPWSAHSWVPLPAALGDVPGAVPRLGESLAGAARLGVQVLVLHAAGAPPSAYPERSEALSRALQALGPAATAAGITLALENCADRRDLDFLAALLERLALPFVGFNVDTGHAVLHGMTPAEVIRVMGPRLVTTHLQDNLGLRDDHLPPGAGSIPWQTVRDALAEVGYGGMLMVEISDRPPGREPDPVGDTRAAASFLRKLFAEEH
ncbi:MAG: sugar phosphate isomerase/epimerase [Lentisphaeria bacterium]|nr:sugar phosphate isomerase/epimerase [Lentisphaeria bacterium]